MDLFTQEGLYFLALVAPGALLSLTVHEFAHARTALTFGDPTAQSMGRVSLNPLVHLDVVGTICILLAGFGWAKPVPVNPYNLRPPKWGDIAVSIAGPLANLTLALLCGIALVLMMRFGFDFSTHWGDIGLQMLLWTFAINIGLCVFNLIPLYPLDGHHIVRELLTPDRQQDFMDWQVRRGSFVLIGLIFLPRLLRSQGGQIPEWADPIHFVLDHAQAMAFTAMAWFI